MLVVVLEDEGPRSHIQNFLEDEHEHDVEDDLVAAPPRCALIGPLISIA